MSAFPWREAMQLGFGTLRLSSKDFWGMTPRELSAAFEAMTARRTAAPDRGRLDDLMERYPDGR